VLGGKQRKEILNLNSKLIQIMFQKVHQRQVNALKKTEVVREMSRSLNRQVLLLRLSAVSHCKDWFPVIYSSARLSFHS